MVTNVVEPLSGTDSAVEIVRGETVPARALFGSLRPTGQVERAFVEEFQAGRETALANKAAPPVTVVTDSGPHEVYAYDHTVHRADTKAVVADIERTRIGIRRDALLGFLTEKRHACAAGLSSLYEDQHPGELQAWLNNPAAKTLVIAGRTGNGKTQAACATAAQAARYGAMQLDRTGNAYRRELLVRGWEIETYLQSLRPDGSPDPAWKIRTRARVADLVVFDELGAEMDDVPSEFVRKEMASILNARLERGGRTIFTTNATKETIKEKMQSRFWSRLQENATVLIFTGPDRRVTTELTW